MAISNLTLEVKVKGKKCNNNTIFGSTHLNEGMVDMINISSVLWILYMYKRFQKSKLLVSIVRSNTDA